MAFVITSSTPYVWSSSSWDWTSTLAAKTWAQQSLWLAAENTEAEATIFSGEALAKGITKGNAEDFGLSEVLVSERLFELTESFSFTDGLTNQWDAVNDLAEGVIFGDGLVNAYVAEHAVPLKFRDRMKRTATARFGDLLVRDVAMTAAEFAARWDRRGPAGYLDFKELVPADYSYEDAVVWMRVQPAPQSVDTLSITEGRLNVDVPDVVDRGSASVTSGGGLVVNFNRDFYAAPEVTASWKGGATKAIVHAHTVTKDGFILDCYDASNPATLVAADVSWSALGY